MMRGTFADAQRISAEKRAAKQDQINQERNKLLAEINNLKLILSQKDLDNVKKSEIINNLQKNVVALKDNTINQLNQRLTDQANSIKNLNTVIVNKDNQIGTLTSDIASLNNKINNLTGQIATKDNEIKVFRASIFDKDKEISNLNSDNDKLNVTINQKNNLIEELNLKINKSNEALNLNEIELLKYIENEFVKIDINEQDDLVIIGDYE